MRPYHLHTACVLCTELWFTHMIIGWEEVVLNKCKQIEYVVTLFHSFIYKRVIYCMNLTIPVTLYAFDLFLTELNSIETFMSKGLYTPMTITIAISF